MKKLSMIVLGAFFVFFMGIASAAGLEPGTPEYERSLLQDIESRLALPQTEVPRAQWYTERELNSLWGPMPAKYPGIEKLIESLPHGTDITQWQRDRVVAIAKHYIGLPYRHHHIPAWAPEKADSINRSGPGLDCSNFTSWVYNFGFGLILNGDVEKQAAMEPRAGYPLPRNIRRIGSHESFQPGDLLYITNADRSAIAHTVIFIDNEHIIDSTDGHVAVRNFSGWYRTRLSHGLRIFN